MYTVYFLINDKGEPYYVGVTARGNNRYVGVKRLHFKPFKSFTSRYEAAKCETFWIKELNDRGFRVENKQIKTHPVKKQSHNTQELRVRIFKRQKRWMEYMEEKHGIDSPSLLQIALLFLMPKFSNHGATEESIVRVYRERR